MFKNNRSIILLTKLSKETDLQWYEKEGSFLFKRDNTCASFQLSGKDFSDNDLSKSSYKGLQPVYLIDFNIIWILQSGPSALLTGKTDKKIGHFLLFKYNFIKSIITLIVKTFLVGI